MAHLIKLIILIFLSLGFLSGDAQSVEKVTGLDFIRFSNSQVPFTELKTEKLFIRVYKVAAGVSWHALDTDEVDHYLYVAVSEYGEQPKMNLFKVGPFFYPTFQRWSNTAQLAFTYMAPARRNGLLTISLNTIRFSNN